MGEHQCLPICIYELRQEGNTFMVEERYALQMQDITVEFPGVLANDHVSIDCKKGEVLGNVIKLR